jgi:DNA polymerase III epsilon subunit-like protein
MKYLFIDTETTGLTKDDEIIQIAWIGIEIKEIEEAYEAEEVEKFQMIVPNQEVLKTFCAVIKDKASIYVKTEKEIKEKAYKVNGITKEMLDEKGIGKDDVRQWLKIMLEVYDVVVGYNVEFDWRFIKKLLNEKVYISRCDVMKLMQSIQGNRRSLLSQIQEFNLDPEVKNIVKNVFQDAENCELHDARYDVAATLALYLLIECRIFKWRIIG